MAYISENKQRIVQLYLSGLLLLTSTSAFTFVGPTSTRLTSHATKSQQHQRQERQEAPSSSSSSPLHALIYGWDDGGDDTSYIDSSLDDDVSTQCSPLGIGVAESLSYDPDRVGSLARLAVAFSPPERGLSLEVIEKVDVICVARDHIDIQAIICESGGCVSVSVPVKFPYSCEENAEWYEGCVIRNLDELDTSASPLVQPSQGVDANNQDGVHFLDTSAVKFPNWWIPPGFDAVMADECDNMRLILNEEEYSTDVVALAQDSLQNAGEVYSVKTAKVAAVGPTGLCFKLRAIPGDGSSAVTVPLDVFYPFGQQMHTVDQLRAAVLGAIATA